MRRRRRGTTTDIVVVDVDDGIAVAPPTRVEYRA
jgi:hypothetical protein